MERREEQPSSTDELAYGRPAEDQERRYEGGAEDPGAGHQASAPDEPGAAPIGGATTADPAASRPPDTGAPRPEEPAPQGAGAPMGAERGGAQGAGAPAAEPIPATDAEPDAGGGHAASGNGAVPLLSSDDTDTFERRWQDIQVGFVDEPSRCVEQADGLVAEVMKRLAEGFAEERRSLEGQWSRGDEVSTEDLRVALQRYRSFFNRLLSTSG